MTLEDLKRIEDNRKQKLQNLADACANATNDEMKAMWYKKLIKLGEEYGMSDYVSRKLIH